jgi:PAS domain S-box-containing protein
VTQDSGTVTTSPTNPPPPAADNPSATDEISWQVIAEELSVAQEELRQQNDQLVATTTALDVERRRYRELFDFAPDCYLVTDPFGVIREANLAASELLRHPPPWLAGRPLRLYVHPDRRAELDLLMVRLRARQPIRGVETVVQPVDGGMDMPVSIHASPEADGTGRVVGLRWLLRDLTQLKEAQDRALKAERLAAVGQTVAALAHESRNALQRSQSCLRLLALEAADRPKALDYVARVQKAQEDLARLFEDVRGFTAPPVLNRRPCDLRRVWRQAWAELDCRRPGCGLSEDVRTDDLDCFADPFRLGQVFRNLFDNALAAAPDPVRIAVRAESATHSGRSTIRITIQDNGPSLTDEQRGRMFDPFFSTKSGGMGLGLAISRRLIEAHGGTIMAAASEAGGAAFVLTLPRRNPEEDGR